MTPNDRSAHRTGQYSGRSMFSLDFLPDTGAACRVAGVRTYHHVRAAEITKRRRSLYI
jgi:hypothetical protein